MNFNPNVNNAKPSIMPNTQGVSGGKGQFTDLADAVKKYTSGVEEKQQSADVSIKDLLTGKDTDVTSVVSEVAQADMSFKMLVGVRNKLIDAYKQTMNMPI